VLVLDERVVVECHGAVNANRPRRRSGAWQRARELAARTPVRRNRDVDFLRAASITVVVVGHWLMAAPAVDRGDLTLSDMLEVAPWSQWLTWVLQVMPLFFIVGGYANHASWEAARRSGRGYGAWLGARLRRLIGPVVPLVALWAVMAAAARRVGVEDETIRIGSDAAFTPTWFLAVYVMVVVVVPATHAFWRRFGILSFWAFALAAAAVDALAFGAGLGWLRWGNFAFVWLGVHQLGYAWRAGSLSGRGVALAGAVGALALLFALVYLASYPVSMVTVPGQEVSNSRPPTLALLALGVLQGGLVRLFERPARRWLESARPWAATVLVNGIIMTLYLWHVTALVWVVGVADALGGFGLGLRPGSAEWWLARPLWIAVCAAVLGLCVPVFARFEQGARREAGAAPPAWQGVVGAAGVCAGLAFLALNGIGAPGVLGFHLGAVLLTLVAAGLAMGMPRIGAAR
jgi:fucose 4-O-acetylase-like acetyltransferase